MRRKAIEHTVAYGAAHHGTAMPARAPSPSGSTQWRVAGTPATFQAQCRPGSNSVMTSGAETSSDVCTFPVAPSAGSVGLSPT